MVQGRRSEPSAVFQSALCNYPLFPEGIIQVFSLSRMHNLNQVPVSKSLSRNHHHRPFQMEGWKESWFYLWVFEIAEF